MSNKKRSIDELDENMRVQPIIDHSFSWHDPTESPFTLSGFAWYDQDQIFRRLPVNPAYEISEPLDQLADCTAGGQIRFRTNASKVAIKVKLAGTANMNHMPSTGQCGFDCYVGGHQQQQFVATSIYNHLEQEYEVTFIDRTETDFIDVTLNFPLYQGVEDVQVGLNGKADVRAFPAYDSDQKIIFYGTSITQGGCASRPGMAYTNLLSRAFNLECINLGFSGNGKGEQNMARIISKIKNPALLVLDYEPNCVSTAQYKATLPVFISTYREAHPDVPILLISKFPYAGEAVNPLLRNERLERLDFQRELVERLIAEGEKNLHFYEGTNLLGDYTNEATVDGVHPTDLGFIKIAENLEPVIRGILR